MAGCVGRDWDPIGSAGFLSQLAGVAGGFVLAGIVVILTAPAVKGKRLRTLLLFCGAFFALAFDSYLYAIVAGETVCERAWSANMLASGVLGLGAVAIFCGIAWLLDTYVSDQDTGERVKGLSVMMSVGTAFVVVPLLAITANAYIQYVYRNHVPVWLQQAILPYVVVMVLGILALGVIWWARRPLDPAPPVAQTERATGISLLGSYGAVGYTVIVTVAQGVIVNIPAPLWDPAPAGWIPAAVTIAGLLPAAILLPLIGGLPRRHRTAHADRTPTGPGVEPTEASRPT
jgi:hypothetical protein